MIKYTLENFDENNINKAVILRLIQRHEQDAQRIDLLEAYYDGDHKIRHRQRGEPGSSIPNNKIVINYAKYITDTATGYFISNPIVYTSTTGDEIDPLLIAFDHAHVNDTDADNAFEASQNGQAFEYVYASEGTTELKTKNLCSRNTFMIYDTSIEERELAGVYYRAVVDDETNTVKYIATILTQHYIYELNILNNNDQQLTTEQAKEHYFGEIPLIVYNNNHDCYGDYEQAIDLIDAGNTVMSDRVNDKDEFIDAILVISGTMLSDTPETDHAIENLRKYKYLELPDKQTSGAEYLARQLDENGVEILQKAIERDILRMSYVPDFSDESFAGNSSGVAIAFKCLLLEWMTKTKERYYRQGLRKRIRLFCNFLGLKQILINADSIVPHFTRALPTNNLEKAQIVSLLEGKVSQKTLLSQLPFVEDVQHEIDEVEAEAKKADERQQALFSMRPNTYPDYNNSTQPPAA